MLDELIERYSKYSDSELMNVYLNSNGYTEDAKKALETVVEERGGFSALKERYYKLVEKEEEKRRVHHEANQLYKKGNTKNDINSIIHSEILSREEVQEITDLVSSRIEAEKKDVEIKTSTYIGSILGRNSWRHYRRNFMGLTNDIFRTYILSFCGRLGNNIVWIY
ncbi:hypothetical protein QX233_11550 [Chryseobacterium gambrini]|uniref:Uncharacterized protein n=1 Tax=Chryseobacterium gambrini TaxID=373672 RepID=A0AAJ1VJJ1_9FLAO|nr:MULTISPECIES: hypothetical protein [Chryseobacterium]MDN4013100.1 hypothetical protein [Chryseobacterium gambrini]MDN4030014.1 hypothetical protein [Chryseobacterium gambrini]QWA40506.1 hypothetical protein KKI44_10000 [Chryseobacterium sp. ZHDP1]